MITIVLLAIVFMTGQSSKPLLFEPVPVLRGVEKSESSLLSSTSLQPEPVSQLQTDAKSENIKETEVRNENQIKDIPAQSEKIADTSVISIKPETTNQAISQNYSPSVNASETRTRTQINTQISATVQNRERPRLNRIRTLLNAIRYFDNREFSKAENASLEILKYYPSDTSAMIIIGASRIKTGRYEEAVDIFSDYIKQYPLDGMAHFYLGLSHHLSGNKERAIAEYWSARLLIPDFEPALANLEQLINL